MKYILKIVPRKTGENPMMQCLIPTLSVLSGTRRQILPAIVLSKLPWVNLRTGKRMMAMTPKAEKRTQ